MAKTSGSETRARSRRAGAAEGRRIRNELNAYANRRRERGMTGATTRGRYMRRARLALQRGDYANARRMMNVAQSIRYDG